jgi:putative inorganic carbon (HCO3(-)) transporter
MAIILCLVAGLLPVIITPGLLFYFDVTPKVLVVLLGASAALLAGVFRKTSLSIPGRLFGFAVLFQIAALVAATAWSTHPALSFTGSNWRRFGTVTQIAVLLLALAASAVLARRREALLWLTRTVAASGCVISVYAILQYFGADFFLPAASYRAGEGAFAIVRPPGTLGHADYLASYLLCVFFSGLALRRIEERRILRLAGLGCALLSSIAVILSGTRSAWIGLLAGSLFLLWRLRPAIRRKHGYGAAVVLILVAAFYFLPTGARLRARVHWIQEDTFGGARLLLWRDSARMGSTRWLTGYGPETFGSEFPRYQSVELARQYPDFYHESPHNIFLDAFSEQGIPGLAALLFITAAGLRGAWRASPRGAGIFWAGMFAALLVSVQFSAFIIPSAFFYYLAIAVLAASSDALGRPAVLPRWMPAAALVLLPLFLWFGAKLAVAEASRVAVSRDLAGHNVDGAVSHYRTVLQWRVPGSSYDLSYSRQMAQYSGAEKDSLRAMKAGAQAMEAAVRAVNYSELRQNAFYHLAILFAGRNDAPNTEKALRGALSAAPNWFKPHWSLAQLFVLTGHLESARAEAEIAVDLDGGKHPEVSRTLGQILGRVNSGNK